jgi:hypothetical protein
MKMYQLVQGHMHTPSGMNDVFWVKDFANRVLFELISATLNHQAKLVHHLHNPIDWLIMMKIRLCYCRVFEFVFAEVVILAY